jgi:HPt (histidine-containing phosphotransfer) domain-containing protein
MVEPQLSPQYIVQNIANKRNDRNVLVTSHESKENGLWSTRSISVLISRSSKQLTSFYVAPALLLLPWIFARAGNSSSITTHNTPCTMIADFEGETPEDKFQEHTLQTYSDGDLEFEKDLIVSYKQSIEEHLPKLREALEKDDVPEAILHSHDIKGSSSYIGAEAVRFVSGKIEALSKNKNLKEASLHIDELSQEVAVIFVLLDKYMGLTSEEEETPAETKPEPQKEKASSPVKESSKETP